MHDEGSSVVADEARTDHAILSVLLGDDAQRPWAESEIAREIGDPLATTDGLARLYGAGLIHRCGEFVFATRPALVGWQLAP